MIHNYLYYNKDFNKPINPYLEKSKVHVRLFFIYHKESFTYIQKVMYTRVGSKLDKQNSLHVL